MGEEQGRMVGVGCRCGGGSFLGCLGRLIVFEIVAGLGWLLEGESGVGIVGLLECWL